MSEPTTQAVHTTIQDQELRERFIAMAAIKGHPDPVSWVNRNIYALATSKVNNNAESIATILQYAHDTYRPAPLPGENPGAVTDNNLREAVEKLMAAQAAAAATPADSNE